MYAVGPRFVRNYLGLANLKQGFYIHIEVCKDLLQFDQINMILFGKDVPSLPGFEVVCQLEIEFAPFCVI